MSNFKQKTFRSRKYLDWVKTLPCRNCGAVFEIDPHHLTSLGLMGGAGTKAPDTMVMPLCRTCHTDMHDKGDYRQYQWEWIARTLNQAINDGVLKI